MSLPQEVVQDVFQVIEGGSNLGTPAEIIQFPTDNGQSVYNVVQKTYQGTNGTAFNYFVVAFESIVGGVAAAVSAGAAFITMPLAGSAGAIVAITAALGITTGYTLYSLSPEFWDSVAEDLIDAGETIEGKLIALINENGNLTFSENAIEIIKNNLLEYGAINPTPVPTDYENGDVISSLSARLEPLPAIPPANHPMYLGDELGYQRMVQAFNALRSEVPYAYGVSYYATGPDYGHDAYALAITSMDFSAITGETYSDEAIYSIPLVGVQYYTYNGQLTRREIHGDPNYVRIQDPDLYLLNDQPIRNLYTGDRTVYSFNIAADFLNAEGVQEGAVPPNEDPFPQRYPDWIPWEFPIIDPEGTPQQLPDRFPVEYPDLLPETEPYQDPAQDPNPDVETDPDEVVKTLENPNNDPRNQPEEEPEIQPDPDPEPEPDPIPEEPEPDVNDDPIDPNKDPEGSPTIVVPPLPDTVDSSKLFTVYNPTQAQLDSLGGYLWDASIIAAIRDIWQEPMDGLISLQQVFVTPTTSGSHDIILGFLDSGVSAAVVSSQFVTVDCGTVSVEEDKKNATDYAPYTSLHLYLPFIGIVELDTNECMNADISVKYKVDVYTGTCLAQVSVDRDADMPHDPILYTFSGNCSQQLPLTSGNSTGVLSALLAGVGVGVSIASGGGLSTVAGYHLAGSSLTHEMMHVSHSGNISANAGIMGQKKPYLIIGRRHGYDANNYNAFYGFPANKTVFLGNHTGYVKVKKCWVKTSATQQEYDEIMRLLEEEGVFI